jgi:hypothetical protein
MTVLSVLALMAYALTALLAIYYVAKGLAADFVLLGGCALMLVLWAIQGVVLALADLGAAGPAPDRITLYGYLLSGLALTVGSGWLGAIERSRWGSAGILAVAITMAVLQLRLPQIWPGGPA